MRVAAQVFLVLGTGCATSLARMEPIAAKGQDVQFSNGRLIGFSRVPLFDVAVFPKGGPTGSYKLEQHLELIAGIHNRDSRLIEVSESNISATGNQRHVRVVRATEIEDSILSNASWAQAQNVFDGAMNKAAARAAGITTLS